MSNNSDTPKTAEPEKTTGTTTTAAAGETAETAGGDGEMKKKKRKNRPSAKQRRGWKKRRELEAQAAGNQTPDTTAHDFSTQVQAASILKKVLSQSLGNDQQLNKATLEEIEPHQRDRVSTALRQLLDKITVQEHVQEHVQKHDGELALADAEKETDAKKEQELSKKPSKKKKKKKALPPIPSPAPQATQPAEDSQPVQAAPKKKKKKKKAKKDIPKPIVHAFNPNHAALVPVQPTEEQAPVPRLSYGLDRALFNPGVYHLQDPRSRVFNFDPYLSRIMPIKEFDFNALKDYITSSKDVTLIEMAKKYGMRYTGSTSSMTSTLAHFHYLLSSWRPLNYALTSNGFKSQSDNFTKINKAPVAFFLHYKNGTYAIDADKEFDTGNILTLLGKSMEKLLTLPKEEFELYRATKSDQLSDEARYGPETYHYSTLGKFMMRSQLDAYDPRIPGTGMFDLKTRAVVSVRMNIRDFERGLGYEIRNRFGQWESFEREYYDMIRSAFLKYSLQVRMGRMDGIFVAYHNTQRIFGFQYISLPEMDLALHGTTNPAIGDQEFKASLALLQDVLDKATERFPDQTLRFHVETRPSDPAFMYIFARPISQKEITEIEAKARGEIEAFENNLRGLSEKITDEVADEIAAEEQDVEEDTVEAAAEELDQDSREAVWEDVMEKIEETLEDEEQGVTAVREAIEDALQQSGLLSTSTPEEAQLYLDDLLDALKIESSVTEEAAEAVEESEIAPAERDGADTATSVDAETQGSVFKDEGPPVTLVEEDAQTVVESIANVVDAESQQQVEESDESHSLAAESDASDEEPSLKDLILRLAAGVKHVPVEEIQESAAGDDEVKLRSFEKILSQLVLKTKEPPNAGISSGAEADDIAAKQPADSESKYNGELLGMVLTIRNLVNGKYQPRPDAANPEARWEVEYLIEEMPEERARTVYHNVMDRRRKDFSFEESKSEKKWGDMFQEKIKAFSQLGQQFRKKETELARKHPVHVYGLDEPLDWKSVFGPGMEEGLSYKPWTPAAAEKTTTASSSQGDVAEGGETSVPQGAETEADTASTTTTKWEDTEHREKWVRDIKAHGEFMIRDDKLPVVVGGRPQEMARAIKQSYYSKKLSDFFGAKKWQAGEKPSEGEEKKE